MFSWPFWKHLIQNLAVLQVKTNLNVLIVYNCLSCSSRTDVKHLSMEALLQILEPVRLLVDSFHSTRHFLAWRFVYNWWFGGWNHWRRRHISWQSRRGCSTAMVLMLSFTFQAAITPWPCRGQASNSRAPCIIARCNRLQWKGLQALKKGAGAVTATSWNLWNEK